MNRLKTPLPRSCPQCRYDLRGAGDETQRCPECGQPLTPAALAGARERRFLWRLTGVVALVVIAGLAVAATMLSARGAIVIPLFAVIMALGAAPMLAAAAGDRALPEP